jgi:hypothetical protein
MTKTMVFSRATKLSQNGSKKLLTKAMPMPNSTLA